MPSWWSLARDAMGLMVIAVGYEIGSVAILILGALVLLLRHRKER